MAILFTGMAGLALLHEERLLLVPRTDIALYNSPDAAIEAVMSGRGASIPAAKGEAVALLSCVLEKDILILKLSKADQTGYAAYGFPYDLVRRSLFDLSEPTGLTFGCSRYFPARR